MGSILAQDPPIPELYDLTGITPVAAAASGSQLLVPNGGAMVQFIVTAGAETNGLRAPQREGDLLALTCRTFVGNRVVTASAAINVAGKTIMTFSAVGQTIYLQAVQAAGALVWRVLGNDTVGLS